MIIVIANTTRNSGKTMMALNIAATAAQAEHNVLAIDCADGALLDDLANRNEGAPIVATQYSRERILLQQARLARFRWDDIIIDANADNIATFRAALLLAHLVLIPFRQSSELEDMITLLTEARTTRGFHIQALAFRWLVGTTGDAAAVTNTIPEGVDYLDAHVGHHKAYCAAAGRGRGILEESFCDPMAAAEFRFLIDQINEKVASVRTLVRRVPKKYSTTKLCGSKAIITLPISYTLLLSLDKWADTRDLTRTEAVCFAISNLD